nr:MAG TPA: Complement factor D [Caudoviricetes sp.]
MRGVFSTTYPLTACHCYDGMPTSFRWARLDQRRAPRRERDRKG